MSVDAAALVAVDTALSDDVAIGETEDCAPVVVDGAADVTVGEPVGGLTVTADDVFEEPGPTVVVDVDVHS